MNVFKSTLFWFLVFSCVTSTLFSQSKEEFQQLFNDGKYSEIISILTQKEAETELSMQELVFLARSYGREEKYSNGTFYSNKLIKISKSLKDTAMLLRGYNLKTENLIDLNKIKAGSAFCKKISPFVKEQDALEYDFLCSKCGMLYYHNEEYKKAYETYKQITSKKMRETGLFLNNYAVTLEGIGRYDEAITYYKKSIQKEIENKGDITINLSNIAKILMHQTRYKKAKVYIDSAQNNMTEKTTMRSQKELYETQYTYYINTKKYEKAIESIELTRDINEQIFNKKLNEEIKVLKTSYEKEVVLNNELKTAQKEKLWIVIFSLISILALISTFFILKYRNINIAHKSILTEQKLLRSQMTPHFIFNSLSVLQGMILNKEETKAVSYLSKFSKLLRIMLDNSREKLVPLNEELLAIQNYVDLNNMRSLTKFKYTLLLDKSIDDENFLIPPMLIQPFIENAILHGFNKNFMNAEISIKISFIDKKLICIIKDNGIGINYNKDKLNQHEKKSLSTTITTERLQFFSKEYKVKCNVTVKDRSVFNEQGTQINLTLPYKINQDA